MNFLRTGCALVACAGAAPSLVAQEQGSPPQGPSSAYGRALDATLERVRERIGQTVDIWEDHSTWENAWEVKTDHFAVRTTVGYGFGMYVAEGLEIMLGLFQNTLGMEFAPAEPLPVFILPDVAAYNTFGGNADEHSSFYGSFYANTDPQRPVAAVYMQNLLFLQMHITHSVVHQYLAAAYPDATPPLWVGEGLAAYFANFWVESWSLEEWARIRTDAPPLSDLLTDGLPAYGNRTHERFIKLGMLFRYLIEFREDTRTMGPAGEGQAGPFRDYLAAAIRGRIDADSPVHALLSEPDELDRALLEFDFPR